MSLLTLGVVPEGSLADRVAFLALATVGLAILLGWFELAAVGPRSSRWPAPSGGNHASRQWLLVTVAVAASAALAIQPWFRFGSAIGLGDTVMPGGVAWLGRLFEPWTWSGFSLGEPSQLPLTLPWAAIVGVVHWAGGDPGLAQRLWYTALYVGAGIGALGLAASLGLRPVAGLVCAAAFLFNPSVVSEVNLNPVFLCALCPLAVMPAAILAAGTGRLSVRSSSVIVAGCAPLLGFVFLNPPLVGMILCATLGAPLLVGWVDGGAAALRSVRALLLAIPILMGVSAYWIVPAVIHLEGFSGSHLAGLATWSFTEVRATLRNAFWLNTVWGWRFPEFYPFASLFERLPLSLLRFVLPAMAFGALLIGRASDSRSDDQRELRIAIAAATVALFLILLSTGTNPPGNIIFNPLYNYVPLGWLLREPGRFLLLASAMYAVLISVGAEAVLKNGSLSLRVWNRSMPRPILRASFPAIAIAVLLCLGFPIYSGAEAPDQRQGLPSAHVQIPKYWQAMADFVDRQPQPGGVLILPPDDFYGMPYSWGYYGADSFIPELFSRRVLVPNPQGYSYIPASPALIGAVGLTAQSILRHDWRLAGAIATALDTPFVLIRRDIVANYPGRSILSPTELAQALAVAPNFVLVREVGQLSLFALTAQTTSAETAPYVTVNTEDPDLRLLKLLPAHTALVSAKSILGAASISQAPLVSQWTVQGSTYWWRPDVPAGARYRVAELNSGAVMELGSQGNSAADFAGARIRYEPSGTGGVVTVSLDGRSAILDGDFRNGPWGPVGDCAAFSPSQAVGRLRAVTIEHGGPGGIPTLELEASMDSACISQRVIWRGGPLVVSLLANRLQGNDPRICFWELGPQRCAIGTVLGSAGPATLQSPCCSFPLNANPGEWQRYRVSVAPDPGTTALQLYLYADGSPSGNGTTVQYAEVRVDEVPNLPSFAVVADATPNEVPPPDLQLIHQTFSSSWTAPAGATHVLVDGMLDGWLTREPSSHFAEVYGPSQIFYASKWISLATLGLILVAFAAIAVRRSKLFRTWLARLNE